jgi:hypothetical protein
LTASSRYSLVLIFFSDLIFQMCAHAPFVDSFPDRVPKPRKHRPYFRDPRGHNNTWKKRKHGVSCQKMFSYVNSQPPELFHFPTILDDGVDMMVRMLTANHYHPQLGSFLINHILFVQTFDLDLACHVVFYLMSMFCLA